MAEELATRLLGFIQKCVPTYQAAEVLLHFAAHPEREFTPEDIVAAMRPVVVSAGAVREYVGLFVATGVVAERNGGYIFAPATPDVEQAVGDLRQAYNERPVTLIGTIYRIADSKIRSFSDSFKLRKD